MGHYINISHRDWIFVFIFGVVFGGFLGAFVTLLSGLTQSMVVGFTLGVIFGVCIFVYSFILINASNRYILKILPVKLWTGVSLFISFLAGALGSISAYILIRQFDLIKPISIQIAVIGSILIGFLTAVIGYLLYTIVSFRKKEMDLEKSVIESRLKALEYQINPHYLFNSLNVIAELIYIDKDKAEEAIIKLSRFLRDIIEEDSLITICKELDIVKNFLFIQTIRFPDIKVNYNIDSSVLGYYIPKLTIQLLVENAIKHGIKSKGNIWIDTQKDGNYILIKVADDGRFFKDIKEGVGLKNLKTRISLLTDGDIMWKRENDKTIFIVKVKADEKSLNNKGRKSVLPSEGYI